MKKLGEIRRALVVDDEADMRELLGEILTELKIDFDTAADGEAAIKCLQKRTYHVVLSDIMMPKMTGIELLTHAQHTGIETPFVFVTGFEDTELMMQAIRLGAMDFIQKPFKMDEISEVMARTIEIGIRRKRIADQIFELKPELYKSMKSESKMIALLRLDNNKKRTG